MKRDAPARLAQLGHQHGLDARAVDALAILLDALAEPAAPTAVHDARAAVDVHLADSLAALGLPEVRDAREAADLGSGAGVPGLVLAAALPGCRFWLVESVRRKAAWINATAARTALRNVEVVWARAEEWEPRRARCELVTARALAALPVLCEYAAPLLCVGGSLVCWKGAVADEEAENGDAAARLLGLETARVLTVDPYAGSQRRTLWTYRKTSPTPPGFPRRAGMAVKRPLTAPTP